MRALRRIPRSHPLDGQTVVITGAGSGIGRSLAQLLAARGCPLVLVDLDPDGLQETADQLTVPVLARILDVTDREGWQELASVTLDWMAGPLGAVFNNAGVALGAGVATGTIEDHDWLTAINYGGVVNGTRAFLPQLLHQRSGAIVNISSVFGLLGVPQQSAYCGAKFAVRGFTESLRHELLGSGVRAVTVHPGGVRTNIARAGRLTDDPRGLGRSREQIADEFEAIAMTSPQRAAEVILFGVEHGRSRILVGADARVIDLATRIAPVAGPRLLHQLSAGVMRRRDARATGGPQASVSAAKPTAGVAA